MKKIFAAALMAAMTLSAAAQQPEGTFSIQPKVGMNVANVTDFKGSDARVGFVAGAEGMYQFTELFGLSAGVLYSQQGCKYDKVTEKLDYINIPIMANVYVVDGLAVKLGVQPGFNVNSSVRANGAEFDTDDAKSFDFSIPVGLSYEFSQVPIVIDARYNWGLTKVWDNTDCKNSVFQFTVGYKFTL